MEFSSKQPFEEPLEMSKHSAMSHQYNDAPEQDQSSRAYKTEEMYKDIIDRVNRSREFLESMQKSSAFNENNSGNDLWKIKEDE